MLEDHQVQGLLLSPQGLKADATIPNFLHGVWRSNLGPSCMLRNQLSKRAIIFSASCPWALNVTQFTALKPSVEMQKDLSTRLSHSSVFSPLLCISLGLTTSKSPGSSTLLCMAEIPQPPSSAFSSPSLPTKLNPTLAHYSPSHKLLPSLG